MVYQVLYCGQYDCMLTRFSCRPIGLSLYCTAMTVILNSHTAGKSCCCYGVFFPLLALLFLSLGPYCSPHNSRVERCDCYSSSCVDIKTSPYSHRHTKMHTRLFSRQTLLYLFHCWVFCDKAMAPEDLQ